MKNLHFGKSKLSQAMSGRGFYIALAVSLLAVGGATYITVNNTLNSLNEENDLRLSSQPSTVNEWSAPQNSTATVDTPVSDVPKESSVDMEVSKTPDEPVQETAEPAEVPIETATHTETPQKLDWALPLTGDVLNGYSNGELVKSKTLNVWRTHDGIDLKAEPDTPVKAAADGTVSEVKEDTMWGMCITVTHDGGYSSHYYGLSANTEVRKDQQVKVGDVLGYVGNTAQAELAEDSHLHFAVRKDDAWIDPLSLTET